ncbi:MAG: VOC family protein [Clostridia bacterium]
MKLKKPNHIGIVVKNISEAAERYGRIYGISKWWEIVCDGKLDMTYLGEKRNCKVKLYYGGKGSTKIELIETTGDDNIYTNFYAKRGEGMHHIMYNVKNLSEAIRLCEENGLKVIQSANFKSGGAKVRYAYMAESEDSVVLELVETTIAFGIKKGDMPFEMQLGTLTGSYKRVK